MRQITLVLAGLVLLPLAVGCSTGSQVIRSQSPEHSSEYCPNGNCQHDPSTCLHCQRNARRNALGGGGLGGCFGDCCNGAITGVGTPGCFDCYWGNVPPTYPPQGAMPGVVQYPYYTSKGPDCFFHQE
jgi:hypothetical protein